MTTLEQLIKGLVVFLNDSGPGIPAGAYAPDLFKKFGFLPTYMLTVQTPDSPVTRKAKEKDAIEVQQLSMISPRRILDEYVLKEELGVGTYCVYQKCIQKSSNLTFAVKIIDKTKRLGKEEAEIMTRFGHHPNIVTLKDLFEDDKHLYLVTSYLSGGNVIDRLLRRKYCSEKEAANVMYVVLSTMKYLHHNGVDHRNLKPSNILYASAQGNASCINICDFGYARQVRSEKGLLMFGNKEGNCAAPEVLERHGYDASCDMWFLGLILYCLLAGRCPFAFKPTDTSKEILFRMFNGVLDLESGNWMLISKEAKSVVRQMLQKDPTMRPTSVEILRSQWMERRSSLSNRKLTIQDGCLKETLETTYRAIREAPSILNLEPVVLQTSPRKKEYQTKCVATHRFRSGVRHFEHLASLGNNLNSGPSFSA